MYGIHTGKKGVLHRSGKGELLKALKAADLERLATEARTLLESLENRCLFHM